MLYDVSLFLSPLPLLLAAGAALIVLEAVWSLRRKDRTYDTAQAISDLSCAALRIPAEIAVLEAFAYAYTKLQTTLHLPLMEARSAMTLLLSFLAFEFVFYWSHRWSHQVAVLWAVHAVHHQSTAFNLASGTRLGALAPLLNYPCFLLLPFVGVPIEGFMFALYLSGSWQFLLHSRLLARPPGRLGFLFNLPCHHHLHHSADRHASNHNYAGVLIVLDRLFGTFSGKEAGESRRISRRAPDGPIRANVLPWRQLARRREMAGIPRVAEEQVLRR